MLLKYLVFLVLPFCSFSTCNRDDTNVIELCNEQLHNRRLLLVSTLDGRLSALDVNNEGIEKWSVVTEPGPLLSSTIHQLEVSENAHLVRIIPSLSGGLYKFDGDFIEPIPVNVDSLLKSYSDDVDISGGKEIRSYGVEIETGKILYHCSMNECSNWTDDTYVNFDIMLIRRETQIVRAIEPQTRVERWNYSVGLHNISISQSAISKCLLKPNPLSIDVRVVVPKGILSVINKSDPDNILWEHQFNSPVVNVWQLIGNRLEAVNVFNSAGVASGGGGGKNVYPKPTLYIGMHNKQWYIQESEPIHRIQNHEKPLLVIKKWKLIYAVDSDSDRNVPQITDESGHNTTTALTMLYNLEAMNGEGFYLYCADKKGDCHAERSGFSMSTFMYWWKEAAVLLLVTVFLINYMLPCPNLTSFSITELVKGLLSKCRSTQTSKESSIEATNSKQDSGISGVYCNTSSEYETSKYRSRYLEDFEPIHCLGKGGFGVVFQARHKVDDCHYAIKRITLPNKEEAHERVMREVKALAKLEHQHIVRYFQSWQECPPIGWQEEQDKLWRDKTKDEYLSSEPEGMTSSVTSSPSHLSPPGLAITTKTVAATISDSSLDFNLAATKPIRTEKNSFSVTFQQSNSNDSDTPLRGEERGEDDYTECSRTQADDNTFSEREERVEKRSKSSANKTSKVYLYIQMQLCQRNSLQEWLCDNSIRDSTVVLNIFDQIVQAVEYVHLQALIHRDLKPSNIFFSPDGQIKVGDFGLVTEMVEDTDNEFQCQKPFSESGGGRTANVGTTLYMSPEQKTGKPYNYKVDIYSLGIILFELLIPFSTQMERCRTLDSLRNEEFPQDFNVKHKDEFNLLKLMLSTEPEKRPTTIGIRARPPLCKFHAGDETIPTDWHFELPKQSSSSNSILRKSSSDN